MQIQRLCIQGDDLQQLQDFYVGKLGFPLQATAAGMTLQCGASQLEIQVGGKSYHHFAFNIPPDQIGAAADWLEGLGIALLPFEGHRIVPFPNWDAEAVYFHDPAGNIVEFIARKRLPASGRPQFSIDQVGCISEIGFATFTHAEHLTALNAEIGIPVFGSPTKTFCALGDDHGLFILVDAAHKLWIPSMEPALPFPFVADIVQGGTAWRLKWDAAQLIAERV
jgi:catechol 2,3-dioxygenase-like lactoylglutathione lyase family enzyme